MCDCAKKWISTSEYDNKCDHWPSCQIWFNAEIAGCWIKDRLQLQWQTSDFHLWPGHLYPFYGQFYQGYVLIGPSISLCHMAKNGMIFVFAFSKYTRPQYSNISSIFLQLVVISMLLFKRCNTLNGFAMFPWFLGCEYDLPPSLLVDSHLVSALWMKKYFYWKCNCNIPTLWPPPSLFDSYLSCLFLQCQSKRYTKV